MTSVLPVQCRACAHLRDGNTCDAYPQQIPDAIVLFGRDHREPYPGDGGVRFEQAQGADAAEAFEQWQTTFGD
jgi:hypothetical protein